MTTVNITTFAFNLAAITRKTLEASLPFHTAYTGATPEQRKQLRHDWMLGHIQGTLYGAANMTKEAERILSRGKGEGAKPAHIKAIDKASSDFRYHVVRPTAKANETKPVRVPRELRTAINALLEQGFTAQQIKACL